MRNKMIAIVTGMVAHGYYLHNETIEQFVDRMLEYGFNDNTMKQWNDQFMASKKVERQ